MPARDPDSTVLRAVAALGIEGADLAPLGGGFASEAWRVGRDDPWLALRIANDRSTPDAGYQVEHALMNAGAVVVWLVDTLISAIVGLVVGLVVVGITLLVGRILPKKPKAAATAEAPGAEKH